MGEKIFTQEELDRIIKKNSAKYLKKLEEKDAELNQCKEALENLETAQKQYSLTDEDVIKTVEAILSIPEEQRSQQEKEQLLNLESAYGHALYNKDLNEAFDWAKENYDGDINEILKNEDFIEFTKDINGKISDLIKKYIMLTQKQVETINKQINTPGSVKDTSGVVAKEYFSKEEVEKMTPAQIKKFMPVIEKSMTKW